jgi:drug/metabolite transporter (DMT)-like permease
MAAEIPEPHIDPLITMRQDPRLRRRTRIKVLLTMSVAVVLLSLGEISLSRGMRLAGQLAPHGISQMVHSVVNIYVIAGILFHIGFLLLYLASLSWEELSYVLPLTAADYVLVTILAYSVLHENVPPMRWLGSFLVAIGIAFVTKS